MSKIIIIAKNKGPKMDVLKENKIPLTEEERKEVLASGAIWHHGPNGEPTPAVWKAKVDDKIWYVCNTHRAMQVSPTLKGSIEDYKFIETTAKNKENLIKLAGRKKIKDRGISWKEHYHERSVPLKKRFERDIGPMSYMRWEGHDYTTDSDYFVVVSPSLTKEMKKRFFAGIKKLPDDPKAKVYAPYGEYFSSSEGAFSYVSDKWGVPFPKGAPNYTMNDLMNVKIPRHIKAEKQENIKLSASPIAPAVPPVANPGIPVQQPVQSATPTAGPKTQTAIPTPPYSNNPQQDINKATQTDDIQTNIKMNLMSVVGILNNLLNNNGVMGKTEVMSFVANAEKHINIVKQLSNKME